MNISYIEQYCLSLREEILNLETKISTLPDGNLVHSTSNQSIKFYHKANKQKKYINKANSFLIKQLATKQYSNYLLHQYTQELADLEKYLLHYKQISKKNPKNSPVLSQILFSDSIENKITNWISEPYQHNPNYQNNLSYKTPSGEFVRSKSELIIASLLHSYHIPYRYECELLINGQKFYPDFTIMHPSTGKILYWEHFGLVNSDNYFKNSISKLHTYICADIIPTYNLILTYETDKRTLDIPYIEELIHFYFLN